MNKIFVKDMFRDDTLLKNRNENLNFTENNTDELIKLIDKVGDKLISLKPNDNDLEKKHMMI